MTIGVINLLLGQVTEGHVRGQRTMDLLASAFWVTGNGEGYLTIEVTVGDFL